MRLSARQTAMLTFLRVHGRRSWLDIVSINGIIGDGFVVQTAGTIGSEATAAFNELLLLSAIRDVGGNKYELTDIGANLLAPRPERRRRRQASPQLDFLSIDAKGGAR